MFVAALVPASGSAAPPYSMKNETYIVPTRHGQIYMEVVRPVDGAGNTVRAPAIFTLSPYSVLGRNGDASRYVPRGYARVWADVVGTGNSGGCYDYGGTREKESGYDLVEWIARQPWSTGKVAMIGGSYNGTTANATAVMRPPHLTTIVPEAAISRWYHYAYSGGIRYFDNNEDPSDEGVDTPLGFDFGFAIPPPVDATDPLWADRVASTIRPCDELEHTTRGYDDTPDYDDFWLERDYVVGAPKIRIPVLVAFNWGDWNVKQENSINFYRALTGSANRKLYAGTRWHGHGTPGGDYQKTVDAWFDHYLLGVANGIENMPDVHSEMSTYDGATGWYAGAWPKTTPVTLFAQHSSGAEYPWRLLPSRPTAGAVLAAGDVRLHRSEHRDVREHEPAREQRVAVVRDADAREGHAHLRRSARAALVDGRPDVDHVHADDRRRRSVAARARAGPRPRARHEGSVLGHARLARHAGIGSHLRRRRSSTRASRSGRRSSRSRRTTRSRRATSSA